MRFFAIAQNDIGKWAVGWLYKANNNFSCIGKSKMPI